MAEANGFDLSAVLGDLNKFGAGSGQMQIVYIPYEQIRPDVANGYSMNGIEDLAGNIETIGLLDPLVVRPEAFDRYMLVSGHRRHAAIGKIIQDGSQMFADGVPCIVKADEDGQDPEIVGLLHELRLLLANTDNRSKTSADQNREAEGTERIVARLAELGYPFPGRRRDWVSQLCGMSKSKLARLKVIRDNLEPSIKKGYYDKGKLKEDAAYKLAQLPPEVQRRTVDWFRAVRNAKPEYWHASTIEEYGKDVLRFEQYTCPKKFGGGPCSNKQNLQDKVWAGSYRSYPHCAYSKKCCANCDQLSSCSKVCEKLKPKQQELKAKLRAERKQEAAEKQAREAPRVQRVRDIWKRFGDALRWAKMKDEYLRKKTGHKMYQFDKAEVKSLEAGEYAPKLKADACLPFYNSCYLREVETYLSIADTLGCSLDYLFLRTDVPEVNRGEAAAPAKVTLDRLGWVTGEAPDGAKCWAKFMDEETTSDFSMLATWDAGDGVWYAGDRKSALSTIDQKCIGWWPIPDDNAPDLSRGPQPAAPAGWCTGKPEKEGYYAVHISLYDKALPAPRVLWWNGEDWINSVGDDIRQRPIDRAMQVTEWLQLSEVKR